MPRETNKFRRMALISVSMIAVCILLAASGMASGQSSQSASPVPSTGATTNESLVDLIKNMNASIHSINTSNSTGYTPRAPVSSESSSGSVNETAAPEVDNTTMDLPGVQEVITRPTPTPLPVATIAPVTSDYSTPTPISTKTTSPDPSPTTTPTPGFELFFTMIGILTILAIKK